MNTTQYFNYIPDSLIKECIDYYNNMGAYETALMAKVDGDNFAPKFLEVVESLMNKKLKFCKGNFYRHKDPYLLHTDYKSWEDNYLNVVIPLTYTGNTPNLVIFDQMWNYDSVTWCLDYKVGRFKFNTGVKGSPYEYPVDGLTNQPIDDNFYSTYLSHLNKDCLHGLSGNAYPFIPGSIILFDSRLIHCTGTLTEYKMGLTLRFTNA